MKDNIENQIPQEYPEHWIENFVQKIEKRNPKQINLATGKTPSGHIHLGIMRELLICDAIRKIFLKKNKIIKFRLFIDNLDAAKRFPGYIKHDFIEKYIGKPFVLIPNPFKKDGRNYGQVFGEELESSFQEFGIELKIIWTDQFYKTEEMKEKIRIGLNKNEEVKKIVAKYLTSSMSDEKKALYLEQQKTWMGAMVICEKCQSTQKKENNGTISPNRVLSYDNETDECKYTCPSCEYEGKVLVSSGLVKLNWRLDWPAKWAIFNTVCEPAGKDHCTPGGSYDTGLDLCQNIYGYKGPVKVPYEWLRLGDKDMKTSKGIVFTPQKFLDMADPKILKMLIYQTNPNKHISIRVEEFEQYYNEYERIERIYYANEETLDEKEKEEKKEISYIFPLIQIKEIPKKCPIRLPFKFLNVLAQLKPILKEEGIFKKTNEYLLKNDNEKILTIEEFRILINRATNWIEEMKQIIKNEKDPGKVKKLKYKVVLFSIVDEITDEIRAKLSEEQKNALKLFLVKSKEIDNFTEVNIKDLMMEIRNEINIKPMKIFQAFYRILLNKKRGPRLGPLMIMFDKSWIENRIQSAIKF